MGGEIVPGLVGFLLGLILGPVLRAWLVWRLVQADRRQADLADALLDKLDAEGERAPNGGLKSRPL